MKKTNLLYLGLGIMVVCLVIIFLGTNTFKERPKEIVSEKAVNRKVYSTGISMMLETSAGSGEYLETTDTTWAQAIDRGYIFNATMSKCENGSILTWNEVNKTVMFSGNVSDRCYVYFDVKPTLASTCKGQNMANCMAANYELDSSIYYHDGVGTYGAYEAGDNSYRYAGANPNNYVCFGSTATTCPDDNLYRIIGIFNGQMKLIKKTMLSSTMAWDSNNSNKWSTASLNTYLNGTFLNGLGDYKNKIANHTWTVGGNTYDSIAKQVNAKTAYEAEMINPATADTVTSKIGLMYVNDYRYAADPTKANAWSAVQAYDYDNATVKANNWMYMNNNTTEWTISRRSDSTNFAFYVASAGYVTTNNDYVMGSYGVRPSFYLESSVELMGGTGTQSDPYRITD